MSPVVVVFYVTALYIIFQILTRSDEGDILSHLPATSSFRQQSALAGHGGNVHSDVTPHPYSLPYHLPHLTSPLHTSTDSSTSFWRTLLAILVYPLYLAITVIAIPMPLLVTAINLLLSVVGTILYPFTSMARVIGRTLVVGPLGVAKSILALFYPFFSFVGGVIGVGAVMGISAGWIGKTSLEWFTKGRRKADLVAEQGIVRRSKSRGKKPDPSKPSRSRSTRHRSQNGVPQLAGRALHEIFPNNDESDGDIEFFGTLTARRASQLRKKYVQVQHVEDVPTARLASNKAVPHIEDGGDEAEGTSNTARDPITIGIRKRTHDIPT